MKYRKTDGIHVLCWCLFVLYLLALAYFLFFAESTGRTVDDRTYQYNLRLFREIHRFVTYRKQLGYMAVTLNLAGNVLAFVPFGLFLPLLVRSTRAFTKTLVWGFSFSLLVEIIQLFGKVGSFDVDDILLNTAGAVCGYVLFLVLYVWHRRNKGKSVNT
jgi:glycopeptide antibiotics resistance protein